MSATDLNTVREALLDRKPPGGGTTVTNCVVHMNLSLLGRPANCHLCATDIRNTLSRAITVNEWLNEWKEDAEAALRDATAERDKFRQRAEGIWNFLGPEGQDALIESGWHP